MSVLDKDFEKTIVLINAKIKESANALREATKLANKLGFDGLFNTKYLQDKAVKAAKAKLHKKLTTKQYVDIYSALEEKYSKLDTHLLESAMDDAGWSTSSSYC